MEENINFAERFDKLLNIQPNYGIDRIKKPVKFNYIGLEIEIAVIYSRDRYSFIRTLIKQIIKLVGKNGYFTSDGTILGDYSFEIVLDPMSVSKIKRFYKTLLKIIDFSDGSLIFDKDHNCGLHMNFNKYDVNDLEFAHKELLLLINEKPEYFDENVYKRTLYNFDYDQYIDFQKNVSSKYVGINYLSKKIIEIRNIKVRLNANELEFIMNNILRCLFSDRITKRIKENHTLSLNYIITELFQKNNKLLNKTIKDGYLIIKIEKNKPFIINNNELKTLIEKCEENE